MQLILTVIFAILLLTFALVSLFIIYHIVRYSYSKSESVLMLAIFIPVVSVLMLADIVLFFSINFEEVLPIFF